MDNFSAHCIPNDIGMSCNDVVVQKALTTYPTDQQKRSF